MGKTSNLPEFKIIPELRDVLPALTSQEFDKLDKLIGIEGCRDTLVIWKGKDIIVDGHNRYKICHKRGIEFTFEYMEFSSTAEAMRWVYENQAGRRNLTQAQKEDVYRKVYEQEKKGDGHENLTPGPPVKNKDGSSVGQNDPPKETRGKRNGSTKERTSEKLAIKDGVSEKTFRRGVVRSRKREQLAPSVKTAVLNNVLKLTDKELDSLIEFGKSDQDALWRAVRNGEYNSMKDALSANGVATDEPVKRDGLFEAPLPEAVQAMLLTAVEHKTLMGKLTEVLNKAKDLADGNELLGENMSALTVDIKNAREVLSVTRPHCVCPVCKGRGCPSTTKGKHCHMRGWMTREQAAGFVDK